MKMIKFAMAAGVLAVSSGTFAADNVCNGSSAGGKSITATSNFIVNDFTAKCSANVHMDYAESPTQIGVCAGSQKGNKKYGGSSEGGSVKESTGAYDGAEITANADFSGC
ncbi:hypothetical protein ACTSKR_01575 [Chitinibacteraceae bacterium HSL-7]